MKRVYFHIDELSRDSVVASALKLHFRMKDVELVYGNRAITTSILDRYKHAFDAIIIPKQQFLHNFKNYTKIKSKIYCLYTESIGVQMMHHKLASYVLLGPDFSNGNTNLVDKIDGMFLWSSKSLDVVKKVYPDAIKKAHVIGHPRHDSACLIDEKSGKDSVITVGLLTRFSLLNDFSNRAAINSFVSYTDDTVKYLYQNKKTGESFVKSDERSDIENDIFLEASDIKILFQVIGALSKSNSSKKIEIQLRAHPRERRQAWSDVIGQLKGLGIHNITLSNWDLPFAHWANDLDYIVGTASTTVYESFLLGVTAISTGNIDKRRVEFIPELSEDDNPMMKHVFKPNSIKELVDIIESEKKSDLTQHVKDILKNEVNFPNQDKSLKVLASIVSEQINSSKFSSSYASYILYKMHNVINNFRPVFFKKLGIYNDEQSATFILDKTRKKLIDQLSRKINND